MLQTLSFPINDTTLHAVHKGYGPPLLLIHGSLCDYRYWRWQMDPLGAETRVIAPSLRGYWPQALIAESDDFSVAQHASDLAALLGQICREEKTVLLGHSRGAQVALEMALAHPEQTAGVILADPGFRFDDEPPTPALHDAALQALEQGNVEAAMAQFVNAVNGQDIWRQMVGWFKTMVMDNAFTLLSQRHELNHAICVEQLKNLRCPVLLLQGALSPARYTSRIQRLQTLLKQARTETIDKASHGMNLANPRQFNQHVLAFMRTLTSA